MKKKLIRTRKNSAQAIVEFALVLPILLLLIYGLLEVGRLLFIYSSVVSAARSASRYGAATGLNTKGGVPRYQDCSGMRAAGQQMGFLQKIEDKDIIIWHDEGENKNQAAYCAPGKAYDKSFRASTGNTNRVRVQVSTQYTPILTFTPLKPLTISSISARTIFVSVQLAVTGVAQTYNYDVVPSVPAEIESAPTEVATIGVPGGPLSSAATASATCNVRHSVLRTSPLGMTIYNNSAALTLHITEIQIWGPPSPAGQSLNRLTLGGATIWSGALQSDLPTFVGDFIGDVTIQPRMNKFLQVSLSKNYSANGSEKIQVDFAESACPVLDSSNASQTQ